MAMNGNHFINSRSPSSSEIIVGNNSRLQVESAGDIRMIVGANTDSTKHTVVVKDVLCIPDICANLMSVSQMAKNGNTLVFDNVSCRIFDNEKNLIATAPLVDDLYRLNCATNQPNTAFVALSKTLWHRRLGHSCDANLHKWRKAAIGVDFASEAKDKCTICIQGKQTRSTFSESESRASSVLEIVHSDVAFMPTNSLGGARYFVTFVDDFSRKVFVYPMQRKSEVFDIFVTFKQFVEKQTSRSIKVLRSDNAGEYCSKIFDSFLAKHGIQHQLTVPHTPEHNGIAERMNRTIVEKVRCMLFDSGLSDKFWAEAAVTAAYLINRIPCRSVNHVTPEEMWSSKKPDLSMLRVFGCRAMSHIPKVRPNRLNVSWLDTATNQKRIVCGTRKRKN